MDRRAESKIQAVLRILKVVIVGGPVSVSSRQLPLRIEENYFCLLK